MEEHTIGVEDIDVKFPFKPTEIQEEIMRKVIKSLEGGDNLLVDVSSQSGKTLAVLCAILGWREKCIKAEVESDSMCMVSNNKRYPRILYGVKTHAQMENVLFELKKTSYSPITCAIGSKKKLCFNGVECTFCKNTFMSPRDELLMNNIMTSYELNLFCRRKGFCPYAVSTIRKKEAEILILPYQYLFSSSEQHQLNLEESVIVVDEAQDLIDLLYCHSSCEIEFSVLLETATECVVVGRQKNIPLIEDLGKNILSALEIIRIDTITENLTKMTNKWLLEFFSKLELKKETGAILIEIAPFTSNFLSECFKKTASFLQTAYLYHERDLSGTLLILERTETESIKISLNSISYISALKSFDSSISSVFISGFFFNKIRDIPNTSILSSFCDPLKNAYVSILNSIDKSVFTSARKNLAPMHYYDTILVLILDIVQKQKGYILVFFSSLTLLNEVVSYSKRCGLDRNIEEYRQILVETTSTNYFQTYLKTYEITETVIFTVIGSRSAECIYFSGLKASSLVIAGLPMPPPHASTSEKILHSTRYPAHKFDWYTKKSMSIVNQAIERVIPRDGPVNIYLHDTRFTGRSKRESLSSIVKYNKLNYYNAKKMNLL
eukprot:GHVP01068546.1.p1 GENE.GHVP01068546.1~~GHVP01068546.1.p1  ORF type:complete len:609 (-),score=71.46 GHVP01068546.1:58-1884(-)